MKTLCILGRQPELGLAELERLYGAEKVRPLRGAALLDLDISEIDFRRLGGTMKLARVLATQPSTQWSGIASFLLQAVPEQLRYAPPGKFTLGLSVYNLPTPATEINKLGLSIKKAVKADDRPMRVVPNKSPELNSAQVLHNKLTTIGAWELLIVGDGAQTIIAQTMFVQDIEAYAARDQARPKRDSRVGMLPPKLAQIMVNLTGAEASQTLLDPFCGTGVILQEALLTGLAVIGTDMESRMVEYSQHNLDWLRQQLNRSLPEAEFEVADATDYTWSADFDVVASEVYLGRAFTSPPRPEILKQNTSDVNLIIKKFLQNLKDQTKPGLRLCLALPAWPNQKDFDHLPLLANLTDMGYNRVALKHVTFDQLIYYREGQFVARELAILERL